MGRLSVSSDLKEALGSCQNEERQGLQARVCVQWPSGPVAQWPSGPVECVCICGGGVVYSAGCPRAMWA